MANKNYEPIILLGFLLIKAMEYLNQTLPLITLILDFESLKIAPIVSMGKEYIDLLVVLATAFFVSAAADQFFLLSGKLMSNKAVVATAGGKLQEKLLQQFLKHHFFSGLTKHNFYLKGVNEIGYLKFFLYHLVSSCIWFGTLVMVGAGLRMIWITTIGHFGSFELELIAGILAAYALFLLLMFFPKKEIRNTESAV